MEHVDNAVYGCVAVVGWGPFALSALTKTGITEPVFSEKGM